MEIVVQVDTREKKPQPFPEMVAWRDGTVRVRTERKTLKAGDYRLKRWTHAAGIEKKGGPRELYNCLLGDRRVAFDKQLIKMRKEYAWPVLFIDCAPQAVVNFDYWSLYRQRNEPTASQLLGALASSTAKHGVHVIWGGSMGRSLGQVYATGQMLLSLLMGAAEKFEAGELTWPSVPPIVRRATKETFDVEAE